MGGVPGGELVVDSSISPPRAFIYRGVLVEIRFSQTAHQALPRNVLHVYLEAFPGDLDWLIGLWFAPAFLCGRRDDTFSAKQSVEGGDAAPIAEVLPKAHPDADEAQVLVVMPHGEHLFYLLWSVLVRMTMRPLGPVHQRLQSAVISGDPAVDRLPGHPEVPSSQADIAGLPGMQNHPSTKVCHLSYTRHAG